MSKADIYNRLKIDSSQSTQIASFTQTSQEQIYRGQVRSLLSDMGYGNIPITTIEDGVRATIQTWASDVATGIISTYNDMLQNQLAAMADGLSDEAYLAALEPFLTGVMEYNKTVLVPYTSNWTRQQAVDDFMSRNAFEAEWTIQPDTTNQTDACLEAIQASPMTTATALTFTMPNHQRCPHRKVPNLDTVQQRPTISDIWPLSGPSPNAGDES